MDFFVDSDFVFRSLDRKWFLGVAKIPDKPLSVLLLQSLGSDIEIVSFYLTDLPMEEIYQVIAWSIPEDKSVSKSDLISCFKSVIKSLTKMYNESKDCDIEKLYS
jgi:hypothetical protein